ncbi:MAG: PD-(D/E)XK nuclease family protein [Dehalococcoidales bacterium]|nr:PD-(D/E)XK nuclease family protein [Dehalococcoidales bacterium]
MRFNIIDAYTKRIIHCYFDDNKCFPSWFSSLGPLTGYKEPPSYTKFKIIDKDTGVTLWGTPDGIFVKADGSHIIVDYKTAKYTGTQDKLMPMYEVQLNAYVVIGDECGLLPVSDLALIYFEPVTDTNAVGFKGNHRDNGFAMGFSCNIHKVKLNKEMISPLLAKAKEIYELAEPPPGTDGCPDCASVNNILKLIQ